MPSLSGGKSLEAVAQTESPEQATLVNQNESQSPSESTLELQPQETGATDKKGNSSSDTNNDLHSLPPSEIPKKTTLQPPYTDKYWAREVGRSIIQKYIDYRPEMRDKYEFCKMLDELDEGAEFNRNLKYILYTPREEMHKAWLSPMYDIIIAIRGNVSLSLGDTLDIGRATCLKALYDRVRERYPRGFTTAAITLEHAVISTRLPNESMNDFFNRHMRTFVYLGNDTNIIMVRLIARLCWAAHVPNYWMELTAGAWKFEESFGKFKNYKDVLEWFRDQDYLTLPKPNAGKRKYRERPKRNRNKRKRSKE